MMALSTTPDDLVAIRRAFMVGGEPGAMAELRRRSPCLSDHNAPAVLQRVLAMDIRMPEPLPDRPTNSRRPCDGSVVRKQSQS